MRRSTATANNGKAAGRVFDVNVNVIVTNEQFPVKSVTKDVKISDLKYRTELATGIPVQLQRLHYIDDGEMMDDQLLLSFNVVPGALLKMKLWNEWNTLIEAVARNKPDQVFALGVTPDTNYKTAMSEYMSPDNKAKWLAERAFVALFVATHRGHQSLCQKLISSGADVNGKTSSGRCPLHIAAALGNESVLLELLAGGADLSLKDRDGYTAMDLAKQNGHKNCHRQLIRFEWLNRSKKSGPRSDHPLFAHQYFDSSLKTYLQGSLAQMYCQQILPPGEFEGTGLGAPRRKANSPTSRKSLASSTEQKADGDHDRELGKCDDKQINDIVAKVQAPPKAVPKINEDQNDNSTKQHKKTEKHNKVNENGQNKVPVTNVTGRQKNSGNDKELHGHQKTEKLNKLNENGENKGIDATDYAPVHECDDLSQLISSRESLSGDLIDHVIKKKLHEQHEKGIRGLPYDLWLASRNNTELYQAVKNKGQLDAMLRHPDSQNRDTKWL